MHENLYSTVAQVVPVLLLAMMWDSAYLSRLRAEQRPSRGDDPNHGFRWTKPRVRVYALTTASVTMADLLLCVLVLAGAVPDAVGVRAAAVGGLVFTLGGLLTRISFDVIDATRVASAPPSPPSGDSTGS